MKRPNRDIALFTLSALDALACATGVFVLLLVVLMPYYRNNFDSRAALEGLRAGIETTTAELDDVKERLTDEEAAALAVE